MVIWVIGLSGAGKTTLGKALYTKIKQNHANTVILDGDEFRQSVSSDLNYTKEDRDKNALRHLNLCTLLDSQGINVICCVCSNQPDIRKQNREQYSEYFEIFIDVDRDVLFERDSKGLYKKALAGEKKDVVGVDIEFTPPVNPDLVINNTTFSDVNVVVDQVIERLESFKDLKDKVSI